MTDLGITDFVFRIDQNDATFIFTVHFFLTATGKMYSAHGGAASPTQAFDIAMAFLSDKVREAVAG